MRFAPVALLLFAVAVFAQSRVPNVSRIARAWNSIPKATEQYNEATGHADRLLHERFNPKLIVVDADAKRRETVGHYKAAREALLTQIDALNTLIEAEDY